MNLSEPEKRLQDLEDTAIMDTLPEAAYDDIASLAAFICDTPIAYISFLDQTRQWYKARIGLPFSETLIGEALCLPTLQETELVYIPDTTLDHRFRENPFVTSTEYAVRFYAGIPLINSEGSALGTLCVIDMKQRELSEHQKFALAALGRQVVAQLELRRLLNTSQELALYDTLTGLANRLLLHEKLSQALSKAHTQSSICAVLFIDLDRFKEVNDSLGHAAGDAVLREVSYRLRQTVRHEDTVGRYGGDEFIVVLHDVINETAVQKIIVAIQNALSTPINFEGHTVEIGASIGSSFYPLHAESGEELIRHADSALYQAKKEGQGLHRNYLVKK